MIRFLKRAFAGVVVVFLLVAGAEFALVTAGYSRPIGEAAPIVLWNRKMDAVLRGGATMFRFDRHLFWDLAPGAVADGYRDEMINPAGFRGTFVDLERRPGTIRIACLGDSSTYGVFCPASETFPARLDDALRSRYAEESAPDVEVLNAGVPGYSIFQGLTAFERKVKPYGPDLVVAMFGAINDEIAAKGRIGDLEKSSDLLYPGVARRAAAFLGRYRTFQLVASLAPEPKELSEPDRRALRNEALEGKSARPRVGVDEFASLASRLVSAVRSGGADVVLLGPPRTAKLREDYPDLPRYNAALAEVARSHGVPFLDLEPLFDADPALFLDAMHPSESGHALIADLVAELIVERGLRPSPPR